MINRCDVEGLLLLHRTTLPAGHPERVQRFPSAKEVGLLPNAVWDMYSALIRQAADAPGRTTQVYEMLVVMLEEWDDEG